MAGFERLDTRLAGPILIRPTVFRDERGYFSETYRRSAYSEVGILEEFVQHNPLTLGARRGQGHALPGRRRDGEARSLRPRGDHRRRGRSAPGLADLRRVGGVPARRREP